MTKANVHGYLAVEEFEADLEHEIGGADERFGRLLLKRGPLLSPAWASNVWKSPTRLSVVSIKKASRELRALQRNWCLYSFTDHRRAALIQGELPHVSSKPLLPYAELPSAPLGSWTLLDRDTVLYSEDCSSLFPNGEMRFVENQEDPPSRAYLKLWEVFTRFGIRPKVGNVVFDLGSAPGGWTWVLAALGVKVISVDKADLDPGLASRSNVDFRQESAFGLDPKDFEQVDWVFSDVICYPARLLTLIEKWRAVHPKARFVCTLKFQSETDFATASRFAAIPGSRLVHLTHNRHELTWILAP